MITLSSTYSTFRKQCHPLSPLSKPVSSPRNAFIIRTSLKPKLSFNSLICLSSETESITSRNFYNEETEKSNCNKDQEDAFKLQSHNLIDKELKVELDALVDELKDSNERGKRGEGLLFAQLLVMLLILLPPLKIRGALELFGTLSITTGVVFTLYGLFSLSKNFTPLPEPRKNHKLVVSGMYSYVRHPLYGGAILSGIGLSVLTRNESRLLFTGILWWVLEKKVEWEERALIARYPEYEIYRQKVKKFFPHLY
mmetsp:Transcript_29670/g.54408  ORF Transcript_29670/g.54408 Transcript_29670/m.54408 type:complete len:254 (-) Transcript_29670:216-977(-)